MKRPKNKHTSTDTYCIGRRSVKEILKHFPEKVSLLYLAGSKSSDIKQISDLANDLNISVKSFDPEELTNLVNSDSHQGCVALITSSLSLTIEDLIESENSKESSLIVALDAVQDPHNVGAVFRAAECFSATAVLWSKNRGAQLTPVVSKVSVGTSEFVPHCIVSNLVTALRELKKENYWVVLADVDESAAVLNEFEFPKRTVLLFGSEGSGAKRLSKEQADFVVKIPMTGRIDSLNISQAAAILMNTYRAQYPQ